MTGLKSRRGRKPINAVSLLAIVCLAVSLTHCGGEDGSVRILQEPLHFASDALEPHISARTMDLHFGKHYVGYVTRANQLLMKSNLKAESDVEILRKTVGNDAYTGIFNNVAQAWNHSFFWKSLTPNGGGAPTGLLAQKIDASFGSYEAFKKQFIAAAKGRFGSGWVWLVLDGGTLKIEATGNADTPVAHGRTPIFTVDVWEHAYYLDYQNRRVDFVEMVLDHLANWDFATARLEKSMKAS